MPLNDLNKELYNYNSKIIPTRTHEKSQFGFDKAVLEQPSPFDEQQEWNKPQKGFSPKQKKILWAVISVTLIIIFAVGGYFALKWWQKNAFHQDRVLIYFEGPKEVDSTHLTKYIIHYKNDNRVTLKGAEITLVYSGNFEPIDNVNLKYLSPNSSKIFVGDIKPKSEETVELSGIFYAPKDFPVNLHASLNFVPSNSEKSLSVENQIGINITAAPVLLSITAPKETIGGYDMEYLIDYKNLDIKRMNNMQIRVDFPQGFRFSNAQPIASENNSYWYIGNLEPQQGGKITIRGQLRGSSDDQKSITVSIGHVGSDGNFVFFDKQEYTTNMVSPVLSINQTLNDKNSDVINYGETLSFVINYKNNGATGLRDAIIRAQIEGKILDFSKLKVEKGSFDGKTGIITWKASDVPALQNIDSQVSGSVYFSVPVKSMIPVEKNTDKNFTVSSVATIDSPDIPVPNNSKKIIGSDKLELKLASKVIFNVRGYYNDSKIKNSGPMPMKVGSSTTFTLHWLIDNISNDISDAKVVSSLPSGISWTGKIYPENENIAYNERTNQITWNPGDIAAGTGVLTPQREVMFQVRVTPQSNQAGEPIVLLNESVFSATDDFTNQNITLNKENKDTQLYEDPVVGYAKGKVAK